MQTYKITTLVDITRSNPSRDEKDPLILSQQSNFNTLVQAIGLRSNVSWYNDPLRDSGKLDCFKDKSVYWIWDFYCEQDDVFLVDNNPVALLEKDMNGVPVVTGLHDTFKFHRSAFITLGDTVNTWIELKQL